MARSSTRLLGKHAVAEGTMAFRFEKPAGFAFKPGQAIDLFLPVEPGQSESQSHAFSIVAAPQESELVIATRMREGSAYKNALGSLEIGSPLELDGPFGSLTLHRKPERAALLVAGGIGITPFMSMLRNAAANPGAQELLLLYSNRRPQDIAFLAELEGLQERMVNFRLLATVTDMDGTPSIWKGAKGKIDSAFVSHAIQGLPDPIAYVSGPPALVQAMRSVLAGAGIDEDDIRSEEFFGY